VSASPARHRTITAGCDALTICVARRITELVHADALNGLAEVKHDCSFGSQPPADAVLRAPL
jgi:hypothetical protein